MKQRFSPILLFCACLFSYVLFSSDAKATFIPNRTIYVGLNNGLVGHWTFDGQDMAGNVAYDKSGQGNKGTLTNGPTRTIGRIGQALDFDATDDYVTTADQNYFSPTANDVTISAWAKIPTSASASGPGGCGGSGRYFIAKGNTDNWEWGFENENNTTLCFDVWTSTGSADSHVEITRTMNDGIWHHYLATINYPNAIVVYIDGVRSGSAAIGVTMTNGTSPIEIGRRGDGNYFHGLIDDVRIYSRALSGDEIKRLYNIGGTVKIQNAAVVTTGLVGYWRFENMDISGTQVLDKSGQGNSGALTNGPAKVAGKVGQAMEFDGSDDYVDAGSNSVLNLTNNFTISLWVRFNSVSGTQVMISKGTQGTGTNWHLINVGGNASGQRLYFGIYGSTVALFNFDPVQNSWHYLSATLTPNGSNTDINTYVNGVFKQTTTVSSLTDVSGKSLKIGQYGDIAAQNLPFNGQIDDVRIYNRALSGDEIRNIYNATSPKLPAKFGIPANNSTLTQGLAGYWSFDGQDMAGSVAYDKSGQGNKGTLTNGPTRTIGKIGQALSFDGVDDYVAVSDNSTLTLGTGDFSWSFWVKSAVTPGSRKPIMGTDTCVSDTTCLEVFAGTNAGDNGWEFTINSVNAAFTETVVANTWYQITLVRQSGTTYFYRNGQSLGTSAILSGVNFDLPGLSFGRYTFGGTFFNGAIDDVRTYNRALSGDEIKRLYNVGR